MVALPGAWGGGGGGRTHALRTGVLVGNLEINPQEVPRSCFLGRDLKCFLTHAIFFFRPNTLKDMAKDLAVDIF